MSAQNTPSSIGQSGSISAQRPLSPHVSIYRPQITSISSIIPRACGVYLYILLSAGLWLAVYSIYANNDISSLFVWMRELSARGLLASVFIKTWVFTTFFAFFLYIFALTRHLVWDFGFCMDLSTAKRLGYAMFFVAFVVAGFLTFLSCS